MYIYRTMQFKTSDIKNSPFPAVKKIAILLKSFLLSDEFFAEKIYYCIVTSNHNESWRATKNSDMIDIEIQPAYLMPLFASYLADKTNYTILLGTKKINGKNNAHIHIDTSSTSGYIGYELPQAGNNKYTSKKFDTSNELVSVLNKWYVISGFLNVFGITNWESSKYRDLVTMSLTGSRNNSPKPEIDVENIPSSSSGSTYEAWKRQKGYTDENGNPTSSNPFDQAKGLLLTGLAVYVFFQFMQLENKSIAGDKTNASKRG
jgi:hypothetical protein